MVGSGVERGEGRVERDWDVGGTVEVGMGEVGEGLGRRGEGGGKGAQLIL